MVNELPTPLNTVVKLEGRSEPYEGTAKHDDAQGMKFL